MTGIMHSIIAPLGGSSGLIFAVDTANVNVHDELIAQGWNGISVVNPVVQILASARIYSLTTALPAITSGTLPAGSTLSIIILGLILGRGGNGGKGGDLIPGGGAGSGRGGNGGAGGIALQTSVPTTITNNGIIAGGGGGGGGGGSVGSGGGGGQGGSSGGLRGFDFSGGYGAAGGVSGTLDYAGAGGTYFTPGGNGGNYGNAGSPGANGGPELGGSGGAPGAAVSGDSLITWTVLGTIIGARVG